MKSKTFSKAGIFSAIIILAAGILLISPDAKALIFGSTSDKVNKATDGPANQSPAPAQRVNNQTARAMSQLSLAPSVTFKDGTGRTVDISRQKGKVLFINFWATWCPPCIQEMPSINNLKKQFNEKDILFLMVDVDDNYKKSSKFMLNKKYDLPVYTAISSVPEELLSGAIPTTVIVDKEGRIVARHEGAADYMHPEIVKLFKDLTSK
jgi:thiol-disulfide isomerase/thioredoxin